MSTINEFPWQEDILRNLQGGLSVTVADLTATIEAGDAVRHDVDIWPRSASSRATVSRCA